MIQDLIVEIISSVIAGALVSVIGFSTRRVWGAGISAGVRTIILIVAVVVITVFVFTQISPQPLQRCLGEIVVSGKDADGVSCRVPLSGQYTFRYVRGAYRIIQPQAQADDKWRTQIALFIDVKVPILSSDLELLENTARFADFRAPTAAEAEAKAREAETLGNGVTSLTRELNEGSIVTLAAVDFGRNNGYSDNGESVVIDITLN